MYCSSVLETLLGAGPNEIRFLHGARKAVVDALIAASVLRGVRARPAALLSAAPALLRDARRIAALSELGRAYKYVAFNGSVYLDCFYPKFPGRVFDRLVRTMLGNLLFTPERWAPTTFALVLSITKRCVYRCEHCYAIETLGQRDVLSREDLLRIARSFQRLGVGVIAWEGGEPLMRFEDLLALLRATRDESESIVATTAYGLTPDKARQLREAGLVSAIISLDHYLPDEHNRFRRNKKAFDMATRGVRIFREAGILPSLCICATRDNVDAGGLYRYLELARQLGAAFVQVLDATPAGSYLGQDVMLTAAQVEEVRRFHLRVNTDPQYRDYPSVSARALLEDARFGCCAGNALCYVDSSGNLQACDLLQISFGNVLEEGVEPVYARMKQCFPHPFSGRCPAQSLHRDIAEAHARHGKLPIPHAEYAPILDRIRRRGPPPHLRAPRARS